MIDAAQKAQQTDGHEDAPVSLEDYAFVTAGVSDGLPQEDLLEYRNIDPQKWIEAETYWLMALMDDVAVGQGRLTLRMGKLQAEARRSWERPIPPLDESLSDWVDWSRLYGQQPEPLVWLAEQGLLPTDVLRLQKKWTQRLAEDEGLRKQHAELLEKAPQSVEVPSPPPLQLVDTDVGAGEDDLGGTGFVRALTAEELGGSLPFDDPSTGEKEAPGYRSIPDLISALPESPAGGVSAGTAQFALSMFEGIVVPFFDPVAPPSVAAEEASEGSNVQPSTVQPLSASAPATPSPFVASPPPSDVDTTAVGGVPALSKEILPFDFDGPSTPPPTIGELESHVEGGATATMNPITPEEALAAAGSLDVTAVPTGEAPASGQLPFSGQVASIPSSSEEAGGPAAGETSFLSASDFGFHDAHPFGAAHDDAASIDLTAPGSLAPVSDPVPFSGRADAPTSPSPPHAPQSTGTALASAPNPTAPLPFVAAVTGEHPLIHGGLTMRQLAALTVEMERSFGRIAELLSVYGLTTTTFQAHNEALRAQIAAHPALQAQWDEAKAAYARWKDSVG